MVKNINGISLKKSKKVTNGLPILPSPDKLVEGELAINYAEGVETLSLKNESGTVVTISSDNYYTSKKLGSGFTGANSALTVTDVIESNEMVIASSLNDLESRKADTSAVTASINAAVSGKTDTSAFTAHTASSVHMSSTEKTNLDSLATNIAAISGISSTDVSHWNTAYTNNHTHSNKTYLDSVSGTVGTMAYQNTSSYSSATQVNSAISGFADSVIYNSTSKYVEFYHGGTGGTKVFEYDASPFIVDGMVSNVEIKDVTISGESVTCLVVSFNTDAGKQDINIPISEIFDASNYYTKSDVVSAITSTNSGSTAPVSVGAVMDVIKDNELVVASSLNDLNQDIIDVNDTLSAHTADTSIHLTSTEKTNIDALATNIAAISGISSTNVSNWNTAYTNNHTHTNKATLDAITASAAAINSLTGTVGTMAFQNANNYSSATQVNTALSGKSDTGHTHDDRYYTKSEVVSAITSANSGSTAPVSVSVVAENELITSTAINALNDAIGSGFTTSSITEVIESNEETFVAAITDLESKKADKAEVTALGNEKLDIDEFTAHTSDTSIHHTHSNKTYLDGITGAVGTMAYQNVGSYSSATQVNTALGGKSDTSHTHASSAVTAMTGYAMAASGTPITTADTLNQAIGKLEKMIDEFKAYVETKELVIAAALTDLDSRFDGTVIKRISQSDYDALVNAGTTDPNTLYVITD